MQRRDFLKAGGATAAFGALGLTGCATDGAGRARVVVVGGGYGGATAAKYLRLWDPGIEVVLVERETRFVSCPMSNLVVAGDAQMNDITIGYDALAKYGVRVVNDTATAVDTQKRVVRLARGTDLAYDRLIVSPGIEFMFEQMPGYRAAMNAGRVLHAWTAGPQTLALRRQLEQMPDGGVYVLSMPLVPYRCPPGPYERVSVIADYFRRAKPRSKIIMLDANPDLTSKAGLFRAAWNDMYKNLIEYRPSMRALDVDTKTATVQLEVDAVKADVLNVVPPHRAGDIARQAGLINANERWCNVDWRTMESTAVPGVHVLGDATQSAPGMPKSGSMANQHAKVAAAAIVEMLSGRAPSQTPVLVNTCYSFVSGREAIRVSSVHQWNEKEKTVTTVPGSGGVSSARSELEARYAWAWARNIWANTFG